MAIVLLAVAPAIALMLAGALVETYDDLWRDIEFGCLLAFSDVASRRLNGWPYLTRE